MSGALESAIYSIRPVSANFNKLIYVDQLNAKYENVQIKFTGQNEQRFTWVTVPQVGRIQAQKGAFVGLVDIPIVEENNPNGFKSFISECVTGWMLLDFASIKVGFLQSKDNSDLFLLDEEKIYPIDEYGAVVDEVINDNINQ